MVSQVTQLRVGDENFLVASMIDRCPKSMMLRELMRNAIEAAQTAPIGERRVEISGIDIDGGMKLVVWNTGRGMDADELCRMCDIASSIRKINRLDQNFGMGAKVASLPSNRIGMRYRSCHAGRVHEVMIGQRGGVYGRLRRMQAGSDLLHDVLDATEAAASEGRRLDHDWTELVLLGNRVLQDTLSDPYDGQPRMPRHWIAEDLHRRFFRLPEDVQIILYGSANISGSTHRFRSIAERLASHYSRHEAIPCDDGVIVHYIHDQFIDGESGRTAAAADAPYFIHGFAGLVHKDEIYDIAWHQNWLQVGPIYGIPFHGRNISVFVEFPDDHAVLPDGYRQFIRQQDGLQGQIFLRQHGTRVYLNRPAWLVELIQRNAPDGMVSEAITATLEALLRDLRVPRRPRAVTEPAGQPSAPLPSAPLPSGPLPSRPRDPPHEVRIEFEPAPRIIMLRDASQAHARGVADRAARYYSETHQLFVNCLYPAVAAMQSTLEREFGWAEDQDEVHCGAQTAAEQSLVERVGRMLVFALAKHGTWADWEMNHALSTQALTLAADDFHQSLPAARAALRARLGLRRLAGPLVV